MSDLESFPDLAAVDAAQGRMNARNERVYTVDAKFRHHVENERARLMAGLPVPTPDTSLAGVIGTNAMGQRVHLGGEPDVRMLQLCTALGARLGPDGKRLAETDPNYRASVESSFLEAMKGKPWSREAEKLAAELASEAASQVADSGLYRGAETQKDFSFNGNDPYFQRAAALASAQGLSDKQFGALLSWYAQQEGGQ